MDYCSLANMPTCAAIAAGSNRAYAQHISQQYVHNHVTATTKGFDIMISPNLPVFVGTETLDVILSLSKVMNVSHKCSRGVDVFFFSVGSVGPQTSEPTEVF